MSSPTPFRIPNIPQRLSNVSRLGRYLRQAYKARHNILQYHKASDSLSSWQWPTDLTGERITPAALHQHCVSKSIPGPCCLCPLKDATKPDFVEAQLTLAVEGIHSGEYIVKCAENFCGYIVPVQRIYGYGYLNSSFGQTSRGPTPRTPEPVHPATPPAVGSPQISDLNLRPGKRLKRSYALLDLDNVVTIPVIHPYQRHASETEILLKLDDYTQPGLYEAEFRALLGRMAKCSCGMIMVQRVFKEHRCELGILRPLKKRKTGLASSEVIDLTLI